MIWKFAVPAMCLSPEQSGHMMSVGYDLYLKLLEEAVQEEKGETPKPRVDCAAELAGFCHSSR